MKTKNLVTRILACALLVATLGLSLASCTAGDKVKDTADKAWDTAKDGAGKIYDAAKDKITMEQTDDLGQISLLSLYTGTETVDEQDVMIQVIKATVLPESATDKSTTWEVYWVDNQTGNEDATVTDYVTVLACTENEPYTAQSGSNYCKVTCKQPFAGSTIGVRVTTVVGGFTAECQVRYEGKPQFMNFHLLNEDGSDTYIPGTESLLSGHTYDIKPVLGNALWSVGEIYGQYEIVSVSYEGTLKMVTCAMEGLSPDVSYFPISSTGEKLIINGNDFSDDETYADLKIGNFVAVTVSDGHLSVQVIKPFYVEKTGDNVGSYLRYSASEENPIVFSVKVKDTVSGVSNTLKFRISDVSSVTLSDSNLAF